MNNTSTIVNLRCFGNFLENSFIVSDKHVYYAIEFSEAITQETFQNMKSEIKSRIDHDKYLKNLEILDDPSPMAFELSLKFKNEACDAKFKIVLYHRADNNAYSSASSNVLTHIERSDWVKSTISSSPMALFNLKILRSLFDENTYLRIFSEYNIRVFLDFAARSMQMSEKVEKNFEHADTVSLFVHFFDILSSEILYDPILSITMRDPINESTTLSIFPEYITRENLINCYFEVKRIQRCLLSGKIGEVLHVEQ